jgi:hypothetical protein
MLSTLEQHVTSLLNPDWSCDLVPFQRPLA